MFGISSGRAGEEIPKPTLKHTNQLRKINKQIHPLTIEYHYIQNFAA